MRSKKRAAERKSLGRKIRRFLRRHFFNKRAAQGSVTVFLIIIMLPMLIFSCSIIDVCKIYMARNTTDSALELAMNSRLASYDDILKDMYGILASSADEDELSEKLATYYAMTLESSTGSKISKDEKKYVENFFSQLFATNTPELDGNGLLNLYEDGDAEFSVTPIATSSVSNPEVMHRQIVEYMKYRGPVYLTTGGLDLITAFTDVANQTKAAKAQLDYEKKLNDAGTSFEKTYENLKALLDVGTSLQNTGSAAFANCYEGGSLTPPKEYINELGESVEAAFVCSFFGGAFDKNGHLYYCEEAEDAFDPCDSSGGSEEAKGNLKKALGALSGIDDRARDAEEIFSSGESAGDLIRSGGSSAANYLKNDFGIIFENVKSVKRSSGDDVFDVIDLFEAYNNARKYSNKLANKLSSSLFSEAEKDRLNTEKGELDTVISEARDVVDAVSDAAYAIKRFMERQYAASKEKYNSALAKLSAEHKIISEQYDRLEWLLGSDGIDKIVREMQEVAAKAEAFGGSIDGIKTTSEKAAMQENYNSGAADMVKIAGEIAGSTESIAALKGILGVLRDVYKAEMNSLESITYFGNELKKSFNSNKDLGLSDCLKEYCESQPAGTVNNWYNYSKYKQSDFLSFEKFPGVDLGSWDSKNGAITDNAFYKVIEKYGKTNKTANEDAKKNAEDAKASIDKTGKEAGSKSGNGDAQNNEEMAEEVEKADVAKFIPENYPVYSTYLEELENAWKGDHSGDAMLNMIDSEDWFSVKPSGGKDGKIPGNYDTSGGDNGKIAENAGKMLESVGNFFVDLLEATRDNLYIAEYLTENFPCFTTLQDDPNAAMISGKMFKEEGKANVVCSVSSLEYILYGDMDSDSYNESGFSVAKASAVLFGVRFALNLIYALTSPTLAGQVEPIVAPLEAIPFAGPIARTAILIGLTLGESAIDIALLLADQEVALFKNDLTWICSPKGFLKKAGESVLDTVIDKGIDLAEKKLTEGLVNAEDELVKSLEKGVDNAGDQIETYVKESLESMKKSIENDVWSPIVTTIKSYIENFKNNQTTPDVGDIEKRLEEIFGTDSVTRKNLGLTDAAAQNDEVKKVEIKIFDALLQEKGALAQLIHDNIDDFSQTAQNALANAAEEAIDSLDKQIKDVLNTVEAKINEAFDSARESISNKLKDSIKKLGKELEDETAKGVGHAADQVKKKLSEKRNESVRGKKPGSSKVDLSKGPNDTDGGLIADKAKDKKDKDTTLNVSYKQYLYVFTVLGLVINEDKMLMRATQLMNANIELTIGDKTTRTEKPKSAYSTDVPYNINKAYTLFKGEAGSKTRTMFLGTSWNKENQTWIRPASNVFRYKATTYVGY